MRSFVCDALLFSALLISAAGATEIMELYADDTQLLDAGQFNYALGKQRPSDDNLISLSVNGDELITVDADCQTSVKEMSSLDEQEREMVLREKEAAMDGMQSANSFSATAYSERGILSHRSRNFGGFSLFNATSDSDQTEEKPFGNSIIKFSDEIFSLSGAGLPSEMSRVFVNGNLVSWLTKAGKLETRPKKCLDSDEKQLVEAVYAALQKATSGEQSVAAEKAVVKQQEQPKPNNHKEHSQQHSELTPQKGGSSSENSNDKAKSGIRERARKFSDNLQQNLSGMFNNFHF